MFSPLVNGSQSINLGRLNPNLGHIITKNIQKIAIQNEIRTLLASSVDVLLLTMPIPGSCSRVRKIVKISQKTTINYQNFTPNMCRLPLRSLKIGLFKNDFFGLSTFLIHRICILNCNLPVDFEALFKGKLENDVKV